MHLEVGAFGTANVAGRGGFRGNVRLESLGKCCNMFEKFVFLLVEMESNFRQIFIGSNIASISFFFLSTSSQNLYTEIIQGINKLEAFEKY